MTDFKFGDMVVPTENPMAEPNLMFVTETVTCPFHEPPCLVLTNLRHENAEELRGWCYTSGGWMLAEI